MGDHPEILERDAALTTISDAWRAAAAGAGSLLLITGPGGIGRTTLLRAACAAADDTPLQLTARGMPLERDFPFGVVRQLLEPVPSAGPGGWDEADPHAAIHGLYRRVADLAARRPLLIAVDDAHWADAPSLRWLSHLAARVDDLPVSLLLAARGGPDQPRLVEELAHLPSCAHLTLKPLTPEATATLVRSRLGRGRRSGLGGEPAGPRGESAGEPDDELCAACYESTGGNPFLLQSLLTALIEARGAISSVGGARDGGPPMAGAEAAAIGPRPVAAAVGRRARQLGDGAGELIRAVAVLGGPVPLRLAAALAGQDLPQAARLADGLRAADVLASGSAGFGQPLEFAYPIVAVAVYDAVPAGERAIAHGKAAALLAAEGAGAERVAEHLLRGEPGGDASVVAALRAAAGAATGRGAPEAAAGYLRRALAEPPDPAARPGLLLDLGLALASVRDPGAVGVLTDAAARAPADARAEVAVRCAGVLGVWGHHDSALRICRDALEAAGGGDAIGSGDASGGGGRPGLRARDRLAAALVAESWLNAGTAGQARESVRAHQDQPGDGAWRVYEALSATLAGAGRAAALAALDRSGLDPARLGGARAEPAAGGALDTPVAAMGLLVLLWNGEFARALRHCDAVLDGARRRGSLNMVADVTHLRASVLSRMGRLPEAADDGRRSLEFKLTTSPPLSVAWAAAALIDVLTGMGSLDEADEIAGVAAARLPPEGWIQTTTFTQSRGVLRVARHRYEEGLRDLLAAAAGWRALGVTNPAVASWRTDAVTAYAATGREEEAAALAAEQLELARAVGGRLALGAALRVSAPFADDPAERLQEAVATLRGVGAPVELARAQAELGARLRRAGQRAPAQRQLRAALETAERCGARRLSGYTRRELLTVGARPRRTALTGPDALTGAERRVAALAAEGLSNRQIAQQLFITQATVETHLRHTFHKLGISSRTALPADLAP